MNKPKAEIYNNIGSWHLYLNDKGMRIELAPQELREISKEILRLMGVDKKDLAKQTQEWLEMVSE